MTNFIRLLIAVCVLIQMEPVLATKKTRILATNSVDSSLAANAEWVGQWNDVEEADSLTIACSADNEAEIVVEFAVDQKANVDSSMRYKCPGPPHRLVVARRWVRVRVKAGSEPLSYIRLQTTIGVKGLLTAPLNISIAEDADALVVRSVPATLELAQGKLAGWDVRNKLGKNSDIDIGTLPEMITEGGGMYTGFPEGPAQKVTVVSTSILDTLTGANARKLRCYGLDADYMEQTEDIDLNGTTSVDSEKLWTRIHSCHVRASGGTILNRALNAGTITVAGKDRPTDVFIKIIPGTNQSNYMVFTVPKGKTAIIMDVFGEIRKGTSAAIDGALYVQTPGQAVRYRRPFSLSQTSPLRRNPFSGLSFPEKTDLAIVITAASTNSISAAIGMTVILRDNP